MLNVLPVDKFSEMNRICIDLQCFNYFGAIKSFPKLKLCTFIVSHKMFLYLCVKRLV